MSTDQPDVGRIENLAATDRRTNSEQQMIAPPVPPKPKARTIDMTENNGSAFSVSAAKSLFEAAKRPEVRNAAIAAAKNPFVRATAKNVAQNEKARNAVFEAAKNPNSTKSQFTAAVAVAEANRTGAPPPPPHRNTSSTSDSKSSAPGKLSSTHSNIMSRLGNLHIGPSPSISSSSHSNVPTYSSSSSSATKGLPGLPVSTYSPPQPAVPFHASSSQPPPASHSFSASTSVTNSPRGVAEYAYSALQSDEMSLYVGDIVLIKKNVDDQWIYGEKKSTGECGIVPTSYLRIVVPLPDKPAFQDMSQIYATALYDYSSSTSGDLTFSAGQTVILKSRVNAEWLEGEISGRSGIFPTNFVDCSRLNELSMKPAPISNAPAHSIANVKAAYDYFSGVATDLQFKEGDFINIIEDVDADWVMGELRGARGFVPKSFLEPPYGSPKKSPRGLVALSSAFSPKKAVAVADYHSQDPSHLYVTRGDALLIVEDVDDYYYKGKLEGFKTLPAGTLPKNIVHFSD